MNRKSLDKDIHSMVAGSLQRASRSFQLGSMLHCFDIRRISSSQIVVSYSKSQQTETRKSNMKYMLFKGAAEKLPTSSIYCLREPVHEISNNVIF